MIWTKWGFNNYVFRCNYLPNYIFHYYPNSLTITTIKGYFNYSM